MALYMRLLLLVQLCNCSIDVCPSSCICSPMKTKGFIVNCSSRHLAAVPELPENTIKLYLQHNLMTSVPQGAFDHLVSLQEVDMSENPWDCDCKILYLKNWLESQPVQINLANVRCATPKSSSMRPFQNLTGNEIIGCQRPWPIQCKRFFVRDLYLIGFAVVILIMMSYVVQLSRRLACRVALTPIYRHKISYNESHKSK
ncbi:platelet glycoprotein IX-like [Pseudophryne corroboree]|uniref:platelet glycoprotein IX-like n=1 Tax=Pseudophryne corroboree TaxID=495146 RepID=UPI003081E845